jgi:DNA-binding NarL/FixJ family response regulator/ligand-binding sensor domain-containing protein
LPLDLPARRRPRGAPLLALALCAWLAPGAAPAIPADIPLDRLQHTRWTLADGPPVFAQGMAQSGDGALWIGSESGLFRFDGAQFQRIQAPEPGARPFGDISALIGEPDGGLWIGLRFGGIYHWRDGRFTANGEAQGLPAERSILKLARTPDGRIWAGTSDGLFVRGPAGWRRFDTETGRPLTRVMDLVVDRSGTLWFSSAGGTFRLAPGSDSPVVEPRAAMGHLAVLADDSLWSTPFPAPGNGDRTGLFPLRGAPGQPLAAGLHYAAGEWGSRILGDRDGGLWAYYDNSLLRLPRPQALRRPHASGRTLPEQAQRFGAAQGLSGDLVTFLFEDRDGNLWVSTDRGLDRFRVPRLALAQDVNVAGMVRTRGGSLLLCNSGGGARDEKGPILQLVAAGPDCEALDEAPSGRSWWAIDARLWWREGDRVGELALPDAAQPVLGVITLKADAAGTLWASFARQGLFRYRDAAGWERVDAAREGLPSHRPLSMARDAQGRIWMGFPGGEVAQPGAERFRVWTPAQGLRVGNVHLLQPWGDAMLVGGSEGLALLRDGRVTMLQGAGGERFEGVTGLAVAGADEPVWIHAFGGLYRVEAAEIERAARDGAAHRVQLEVVDHVDGLRGRAPPQWPRASVARASDGRLWVSTTTATYALDPALRRGRATAPALELRALRVHGEPVGQPDMRLVAEATNGREAIERYREHRPDVALMDVRMPDMDGISALLGIWREFPDARVIVLTTYPGDVQALRAIRAGAQGYLLKGMLRLELVEAIRAVAAGRRSIPAEVAAALVEHATGEALTPRETEVLGLVALGRSNKRTAAALGLSEETVKAHMRSILAKLGATDRTHAVTIALKRGFIDV